ncbi:hypothetical protein SAMN05428971_4214 [Candidatus Pantoea varia]|uniref:Uncharacterized protein n=1 Tax=Candidatus Pantoea varia TaxID=1881036 RepID=A0A1I5HPH2_9GAMM|nr:hypothetical protein SAMN05428971_4214 [Pantoea varia]
MRPFFIVLSKNGIRFMMRYLAGLRINWGRNVLIYCRVKTKYFLYNQCLIGYKISADEGR